MKPQGESGFTIAALLCIITAALVLSAATIPVYQMQARRELEKELLFRGEEYIRAIQKYQRKYPGNYPPSIDDLISRDGLRFLRRQYKDPITGEDFRLISVNPDGSLTNALTILTIPIPAQGAALAPGANAEGTRGANESGRGAAGGTGTTSTFGTSMGLGVSMGNLTGGGGPGGASGGGRGGAGASTGTGIGTGIGNPVQGRGGGAAGGAGVGAGVGTGIGAVGGTGIGTGGGASVIFGGNNPAGGQQGQLPNRGNITPINTPGQVTTNPFGNATPMPQQIGPGIAGVASESVAQSVMIYNTREKYNEWEFVAPLIMQQGAGGGNTGADGRGNAGGNNQQQPNPFGGNNRGTGISGGGQNPTSIFVNPSNNPFTGGNQGAGGQGGGNTGGGTAPRGQGR